MQAGMNHYTTPGRRCRRLIAAGSLLMPPRPDDKNLAFALEELKFFSR
jgi:hypothetical protein